MQDLEDLSVPLVSVVIATYNMGKYLPFAIQSVLDQTYQNIEIHVVDDGSADGTRELVRQYYKDRRITCHYQEHRGQPQAKNKGIQESHGELIAFLDADDLWTKNKLERQVPCFAESPKIGMVYTNAAYMNEDGQILGYPKRPRPSADTTSQLFIFNFIHGPSAIVRRRCLDDIGLFDESIPMGIDWDLWLRLSVKYEIYFLDEHLYSHRCWPGQMSHNWRRRYDCAIKIMQKFLVSHPGILTPATTKEAWADTYVGRGSLIVSQEKRRLAALRDFVSALMYKPNYVPAWKSILKLLAPVNISRRRS